MNDHVKPQILADGGGDAAVESLLRLAGPREVVPVDRMRRLKASAHAEWRALTRARRRRHMAIYGLGGLAAAAVLILTLRTSRDAIPGAGTDDIGLIEKLSGTGAEFASRGDGSAPNTALAVGAHVMPGRDLVTRRDGSATLRLASGVVVRLQGDGVLGFESREVLVLKAGAVYVDSGGAASVEVRTTAGVVRDVGTQFEVRILATGLRVRVRDGAVQVRQKHTRHDASAGDELTLDTDGRATRRSIPTTAAAWATADGAPFELEGRSLREFLDWIVGENGWQLQFADAAVEDKARTTTLHGSIQGLSSEQALAAVLPTSGVAHRLEAGVLSISLGVGAKD